MSESAAVRLFEQAKVINQLQRELEEVKKDRASSNQDFGEMYEKCKELLRQRDIATKRLVVAETKFDRMKGYLQALTETVQLNAEGLALLSEPPSTSLDLYHKERNKKELGEVLGLLDSIMCDPDGNCDICGSDEDRKIGQQALSILKRLTE